MSRRELSQVSLKSDKKNGLLSWNMKFWPGLAEVIFQAVLLSIFKAVFSTKCSRKSDGEWDSSLWWPLWTWFSCFRAVVVCGEAKNSVCLSFNFGQWSVHYWLPLLLSVPLEQIWYCWVVSGKQQRILQSEFSDSHVSLVSGSAAGETEATSGCFPGLPPLLPEGCAGGQLPVQPPSPAINNPLKEGCSNMSASSG